MKTALITGIEGQDGSYLSELLLEKGYKVHGIVRRAALECPEYRLGRIKHLLNKVTLHSGSLESLASMLKIVKKVKPHECYHLAATSFVSYSFEDEFPTINANTNGTLFILSAIKEKAPNCKFYIAASSEMFGLAKHSPQNEETPFHPRSPYGISKMVGFNLAYNYREIYNLFACSGIAFNHESPRRGLEFVTQKITTKAVEIKLGLAKELRLGNLEAKRDWGFAGDYVKAMWLMLQEKRPRDYVIATNTSYSVKEFVQLTFDYLKLNWKDYVVIDKNLYRPTEVFPLRGDYTKAQKQLGWKPTVGFKQLVKMMVDFQWERLGGKS